MDELDEVALNVLLADDGIDPATAFAASQRDQPSPRRSTVNLWAVLAGILIVLAWILWM
ncbi:MAG: hypothetical protein WD063_08515 [Pirellulales bacterium]